MGTYRAVESNHIFVRLIHEPITGGSEIIEFRNPAAFVQGAVIQGKRYVIGLSFTLMTEDVATTEVGPAVSKPVDTGSVTPPSGGGEPSATGYVAENGKYVPSLAEYVQAGYKEDTYDSFVAAREAEPSEDSVAEEVLKSAAEESANAKAEDALSGEGKAPETPSSPSDPAISTSETATSGGSTAINEPTALSTTEPASSSSTENQTESSASEQSPS